MSQLSFFDGLCKMARLLVDTNNPHNSAPKLYEDIVSENPDIIAKIKDLLESVIITNINATLFENELRPISSGSSYSIVLMKDIYKVFLDAGFSENDFATVVRSNFNSIINNYQLMLSNAIPKSTPPQVKIRIENSAANYIKDDIKYIISSYTKL